jgi:hypothetical protein
MANMANAWPPACAPALRVACLAMAAARPAWPRARCRHATRAGPTTRAYSYGALANNFYFLTQNVRNFYF